jgi:hypothetical protein
VKLMREHRAKRNRTETYSGKQGPEYQASINQIELGIQFRPDLYKFWSKMPEWSLVEAISAYFDSEDDEDDEEFENDLHDTKQLKFFITSDIPTYLLRKQIDRSGLSEQDRNDMHANDLMLKFRSKILHRVLQEIREYVEDKHEKIDADLKFIYSKEPNFEPKEEQIDDYRRCQDFLLLKEIKNQKPKEPFDIILHNKNYKQVLTGDKIDAAKKAWNLFTEWYIHKFDLEEEDRLEIIKKRDDSFKRLSSSTQVVKQTLEDNKINPMEWVSSKLSIYELFNDLSHNIIREYQNDNIEKEVLTEEEIEDILNNF